LLCKISACIAARKRNELVRFVDLFKANQYDPRKLYEIILQSYLFCGFPAAIESLKIFTEVYPKFKKSKSVYDLRKFNHTGKLNCKLIYKNNYKKLIDNMSLYSPDLKEWILTEGYGKVMGRKGLSLIEREFINVTILCVNYYPEQQHSHLKGCLNLGATKIEIETLIRSIRKYMKPTIVTATVKLLKRIKI